MVKTSIIYFSIFLCFYPVNNMSRFQLYPVLLYTPYSSPPGSWPALPPLPWLALEPGLSFHLLQDTFHQSLDFRYGSISQEIVVLNPLIFCHGAIRQKVVPASLLLHPLLFCHGAVGLKVVPFSVNFCPLVL